MSDLAIFRENKPNEESLVEESSGRRISGQIGSVAVLSEFEGSFDILFDDVECDRYGGELYPGVLKLAGDSVLVLPEEVDRHGFCVVQLQELRALSRESLDAKRLHMLCGLCLFALRSQSFAQDKPYLQNLLHSELDRAVVLLNQVLDLADAHDALGARVTVALSSEAEEVVIDLARTTARVADAEPASALPAEHTAFQIVVVDALLVASVVVCEKYVLYAVEQLEVDKGLVFPRVVHALKCDPADVVGIGKHHGERPEGHGSGWGVRAGPTCETALGQFVQ